MPGIQQRLDVDWSAAGALRSLVLQRDKIRISMDPQTLESEKRRAGGIEAFEGVGCAACEADDVHVVFERV
jgi:hypothetical protein